jgi:hypothetical protein
MSRHRTTLVMAALLVLGRSAAAAQQVAAADSVGAQIRQTLRAFYFHLAHGDWEAVTSDILAAKVVAHRERPEALASDSPRLIGCERAEAPLIEQSIIELSEEWAHVLVPRCRNAMTQGDQFRLIEFEHRWRFVSIDLWDEPVKLWAER